MGIGVTGYAIIAFGAILAAVIAGSFSYLNLIVSKEQKVSEFRQAWIDSLRDSISEYLSSISYISILYKHYYEKKDVNRDKFEMTKGVEEIYAKVNKSYNDIIFRVNDNETDKEGKEINDIFLLALNTTRDFYNNAYYVEAFKSCASVRDATKPLLKYEWKRVKNGEPAYKNAKRISALVLATGLVIAALVFGYVVYESSNTTTKSPSTQSKDVVSMPASSNKPAEINIAKPPIDLEKKTPYKAHQPTPKNGAAEL